MQGDGFFIIDQGGTRGFTRAGVATDVIAVVANLAAALESGGAVNDAGLMALSAYNNRNDRDNAFNQLPYRMLVPLRVGNLHVAGRCASMEHLGQSAARASGACFAMGQAAGTAAALRVAGRFGVAALQAALVADGAELGASSRATSSAS